MINRTEYQILLEENTRLKAKYGEKMQITLNDNVKVNFKIEVDHEGVSIKPTSCTLPKESALKPRFRKDMNVHLAVEKLKSEYIEEANRRCEGMKGKQTRISEMLGFASYQSYQYWLKRRDKKTGKGEG